jgi:hypothetical protein
VKEKSLRYALDYRDPHNQKSVMLALMDMVIHIFTSLLADELQNQLNNAHLFKPEMRYLFDQIYQIILSEEIRFLDNDDQDDEVATDSEQEQVEEIYKQQRENQMKNLKRKIDSFIFMIAFSQIGEGFKNIE